MRASSQAITTSAGLSSGCPGSGGAPGGSRLLARTRKPYRTLDGWMAILPYIDKHWRSFFELIGRPEVLRDPRDMVNS